MAASSSKRSRSNEPDISPTAAYEAMNPGDKDEPIERKQPPIRKTSQLKEMFELPDYAVAIDTEFISAEVVKGQVVEVGLCIIEVATGKKVAKFGTGLVRVMEGKEWYRNPAIDADTRKYWILNMSRQYDELMSSTKSLKVEFDTMMTRLHHNIRKIKEGRPGCTFKWLVDHGCTDVAHMTYLLDIYGYAPMIFTFGEYADILNVETIKAACLGARMHKEVDSEPITHWAPGGCPKLDTTKAHRAEADAEHICDRLVYYLEVLDDEYRACRKEEYMKIDGSWWTCRKDRSSIHNNVETVSIPEEVPVVYPSITEPVVLTSVNGSSHVTTLSAI